MRHTLRRLKSIYKKARKAPEVPEDFESLFYNEKFRDGYELAMQHVQEDIEWLIKEVERLTDKKCIHDLAKSWEPPIVDGVKRWDLLK